MKIDISVERTESEITTNVETDDWSDPVDIIINMILATRSVCAKYNLSDSQMLGLIRSSMSHNPSIEDDELNTEIIEVEA